MDPYKDDDYIGPIGLDWNGREEWDDRDADDYDYDTPTRQELAAEETEERRWRR